ncbi:hypothetical protein NECAME_00082 [Necator americanus]|uniref:Uncharacterized protein n=1 Tax=Necator americanus TaxID=51031 RepID=W2TZE5_NECAM|nr:hypothetical protein NECAME_00082 [Necator americanus]ETN87223.1 hypothetical protein NECAME_00082 [Necator americanus]
MKTIKGLFTMFTCIKTFSSMLKEEKRAEKNRQLHEYKFASLEIAEYVWAKCEISLNSGRFEPNAHSGKVSSYDSIWKHD